MQGIWLAITHKSYCDSYEVKLASTSMYHSPTHKSQKSSMPHGHQWTIWPTVSYTENTTTCLPLSGFLTEPFPCASKNYKSRRSFLDNFDTNVYALEHKSNVFYSFVDSRDWEMAQWLTLSELSMLKIDKFLSIQLVHKFPSFNHQF